MRAQLFTRHLRYKIKVHKKAKLEAHANFYFDKSSTVTDNHIIIILTATDTVVFKSVYLAYSANTFSSIHPCTVQQECKSQSA